MVIFALLPQTGCSATVLENTGLASLLFAHNFYLPGACIPTQALGTAWPIAGILLHAEEPSTHADLPAASDIMASLWVVNRHGYGVCASCFLPREAQTFSHPAFTMDSLSHLRWPHYWRHS